MTRGADGSWSVTVDLPEGEHQYKFFVNFSETSSNLVVFLEGGGACSSYESCASGGPFNTAFIKEGPDADCIGDD